LICFSSQSTIANNIIAQRLNTVNKLPPPLLLHATSRRRLSRGVGRRVKPLPLERRAPRPVGGLSGHPWTTRHVIGRSLLPLLDPANGTVAVTALGSTSSL